MAQENGNRVRFRVIAEITSLGDKFGFASVVSLVCALAQNNEGKWIKTDKITTRRKPIEVEGIFLPDFTLDHLGTYDEGDEVELSVGENTTDDPEKKENTPWWCYFVNTNVKSALATSKPTAEDFKFTTGNGALATSKPTAEDFKKLEGEIIELLDELDELDPERKNSVGVDAEAELVSALDSADYQGARKVLVVLRGVLRGIKSAEEKRLAAVEEEEKRRAVAHAVAEAIRNRKRPPATNA